MTYKLIKDKIGGYATGNFVKILSVIRKLFEIKCNVVAFIKSLFCFLAVSRKYDDWYYLRGRKISKYEWKIIYSFWLKMMFGTDNISEIKKIMEDET